MIKIGNKQINWLNITYNNHKNYINRFIKSKKHYQINNRKYIINNSNYKLLKINKHNKNNL